MWKLAFILLAGVCLAQNARVEGRVTDQNGKPLTKASISLLGNTRSPASPLPPSYAGVSDEEGHFVFATVELGEYRVVVDRNGYQPFVFSAPDGRVAIGIESGGRTFEIKMTPQSWLTGRVLDEDGEPFPNARVTLLRVGGTIGTDQLTTGGTATAGPDGSYAFPAASTGRYYVMAAEPGSLSQSSLREGGQTPPRYVPTYFPSALEPHNATMIRVPVGGEARYNDIRLRRERTFHLAGRVVDAAGSIPNNVSVNLVDSKIASSGTDRTGSLAIAGMFQFNRLLPGTYLLTARAGTLRARQLVTITDHDVDGLVLTVAPGFEISTVFDVVEASAAERERILSQAGSRYTLTAADRTNDNAMISRKPDGTWSFTDIGPGTYRMGIGAPEGTYIQSIRYGDADITHRLLDTGSSAAPLKIVFSPHAAEVKGTVRNNDGAALAGVRVMLWVPGAVPEGTLDPARSAQTDAKGEFRFASLRPGEYRIAAWEKTETGIPNEAAFHMRFDARATTLKLAADARETIQPVLISAETIEAELTRWR